MKPESRSGSVVSSAVMSERAYLDWNATAPLRAEARAAVTAALDLVGNPSSVHAEGRRARALVETAREQVAALIGGKAANVTFTSGGTEANILALSEWARDGSSNGPCSRLLISAIEHPSVLAGGRFAKVEKLPVTDAGVLELEALRARLHAAVQDRVTPLVSVMLANNETGVVQPIRAVADAVHAAGGVLHVDAVQAAGRIACDLEALGADLVTISAHKIGGPTGIGALIRRDGSLHLAKPLLQGGGQERGLRAGTENVPGIAGFGAAAAAAQQDLAAEQARLLGLRQRLEAGIRAAAPRAIIFGAEAERVPNTTLFTVAGMKAETAVIAFDLAGVAVSSGAACSSGKVQPSHVLAAMGVAPGLARGAVRVSFGWATQESDLDRFQIAWRTLAGALLKESPGMAA
jgi:cysteine desulfurase